MDDSLDDYDFIPTSNSNLASLFNSSATNDASPSLIYTAPKQPKPPSQTEVKSETPKPESNVIAAKTVNVWKLIDNKYSAIGLHGLAIIGSTSKNIYELILYKEKTNVILRIQLNDRLEISIKQDGFASFYDYSKVNWLIKFNNSEDCNLIIKEIEKFNGKIVAETPQPITETPKQEKSEPIKQDNPESNESNAKAEILSRIARMGQSILPSTSGITHTTDISDLDEDNSRILDGNASISSIESNVTPEETKQSITNAIELANRQQHSFNIPNSYLMGQSITTYDPLNMIFTENKIHNSEVRMNLSQISDKLNQILRVVDGAPKADRDSPCEETVLKSKVKVLELKQENLLRELKNYEDKLAQQELIIREMEKSEQKNKQNADFKNEIEMFKDKINNMSETIEQHETESRKYKELNTKNMEELERLKAENSALRDSIVNMECELKNLQEEQNDSKQLHEQFTIKQGKCVEALKGAMNSMYGNIISNFEENQNYSSAQIQGVVAQNIKTITLNLIKEFQDIHNKLGVSINCDKS